MTAPFSSLQRRQFLTAGAVGGIAALSAIVPAQAEDPSEARVESTAELTRPLLPNWKEFIATNAAEMSVFAEFIANNELPLSGMTAAVLERWRQRKTVSNPTLQIKFYGWCSTVNDIDTLKQVATVLFEKATTVRGGYRLGPMATTPVNTNTKCQNAIRRYYNLLRSDVIAPAPRPIDYRVRLPSRGGQSQFRHLFQYLLHRRTTVTPNGTEMIDMHLCSKPVNDTRNGSFLVVD